MSQGEGLLDELCFTQAELMVAAGGSVRTAPVTRCSLTANGSQRSFHFSVPYFVRELGASELGQAWKPFCLLLRHHGIPLFSPVAALQDVPATAVPARWSTRYLDQPIDAVELTTADAFELACWNPPRQSWGWSSEILPNQLSGFVSAVRQAAGGNTPIGIGLPLGCHTADLRRAVQAEVDFISLNARLPQLEAGDLQGLIQCRQMILEMRGGELPILVSAPFSSLDQAHKLLALGASAICIDSLLRPLLPAATATTTSTVAGAGMLSGLTPVVPRKPPELTALAAALAEFQHCLKERLQCVGASELKAFTVDTLRSCSSSAERITGVRPL